MQQRRVRLGDILDDYCPRERRITNHAVVAMIEEAVRLTRCTTCDAEHDYKEAKVPVQRRRKPEGVLVARPAVVPSDAARAAQSGDATESADASLTDSLAAAFEDSLDGDPLDGEAIDSETIDTESPSWFVTSLTVRFRRIQASARPGGRSVSPPKR